MRQRLGMTSNVADTQLLGRGNNLEGEGCPSASQNEQSTSESTDDDITINKV